MKEKQHESLEAACRVTVKKKKTALQTPSFSAKIRNVKSFPWGMCTREEEKSTFVAAALRFASATSMGTLKKDIYSYPTGADAVNGKDCEVSSASPWVNNRRAQHTHTHTHSLMWDTLEGTIDGGIGFWMCCADICKPQCRLCLDHKLKSSRPP